VDDPGWDLGHAAFVTALALVAAGIVILVVHLLSRRLGRWDPVLASLAGRARYAFRGADRHRRAADRPAGGGRVAGDR
jgi:hypothetical protein